MVVEHVGHYWGVFFILGPEADLCFGHYGVRVGVGVDQAVQPDAFGDALRVKVNLLSFHGVSHEIV